MWCPSASLTESSRSRSLLLAACGIVGLSSGTNYVYSAYAPQLAARLHMTSVQTNLVGAAGNLGVYLSGPVIGRVVDRGGPRRMLAVAAVLLFSGYFALRTLYLNGNKHAAHVIPLVAFAELLTGIGSTAGLSAAGNTVAKSFQKTRATALSLVLSAFGLSAFFYSTIRRTLLAQSAEPTAALLTTLSICTALSMLVGVVFVRPVLQEKPPKEPEPRGPSNERDPLIAVVGADSTPEEVAVAVSAQQRPTPIKRAQSSGIVPLSVSGSALVREVDFWLLFAFNACSSGIGLGFINNIGLVTKTLAPKYMSDVQVASYQAGLVSLLSLANCFGRLSVGFLSDVSVHRLPRRWRFSRVWWNVWTACLFTVSQVLASQAKYIDGRHGLVLPTIVTGLAHGSLFGTSGILVLERFGMERFSSNNGVLALAPAIAGQLTNYMFGRIYDSHVPSHTRALPSGPPSDRLCTAGRSCYVTAFHVTTGMAVAAIGLACVLVSRKSMKRRAA
ncbi:hypothetical protein ACM66B_000108 [Microbotryomycetes sp. NB124-2]